MDRRSQGDGRQAVTFGLCLALSLLGGCVEPVARVPRFESTRPVRDRLVALVNQQGAAAVGFRGYGDSWYGFVKDDGQAQQLNFNCKLWFRAPRSLRLLSHATMHGNIDMGCNEEAFWLAVKPELGTYYWGRWDRAIDTGLLPLDPHVVLESLGQVDLGDPNAWSLETEERTWVLTRDLPGGLVKQVRLARDSARVVEVTYRDAERSPLAVAQLAGYRTLVGDFAVPTVLRVTTFEAGRRVGWLKVTLDTFRLGDPPARYLERPATQGFDRIIDVSEPPSPRVGGEKGL